MLLYLGSRCLGRIGEVDRLEIGYKGVSAFAALSDVVIYFKERVEGHLQMSSALSMG